MIRRIRHFTVLQYPVKHLWILIPFLSLPAFWPFYTEGLPRSFDGGLHLLRLGVLHRHILQGTLLPRWTPELILGFGYPLFNFYAPSTYYLAESLHLVGLSSYHAFILSFILFTLAAGWGMYRLSLDIFSPSRSAAALLTATAYIYAPYLLTNIYIRGALAEVGAQALLPWILWSTRRLLLSEHPSRYYLPVVFTLGGLAITHNITLLFLPPILLGYAAVHWWNSNRPWYRLGWLVVSFLTAMGISAFFWLPLLIERRYLAETAYNIATSVWLPGSVWTWENFLDRGLTFAHSFDRPIRLGSIQLLLAVTGFLLGPLRQKEWIFWGVVTVLVASMIGQWSLPIWLSNDLLPVAQFTWRLLAILSLPLALFAGALLLRLPQGFRSLAVTILLLALVIFANRPRLDWMDVFAPESVDVSAPVFAQVEIDKGVLGGGEGNSSIQEFRPRWAARTLLLDEESRSSIPAPLAKADIQIDQSSTYVTELTITSDTGGPLRMTDFYFPGWQALLDGSIPLTPYPSTNFGLLTVDIPPGTHTLRLYWAGTRLQHIAGLISLGALLLAATICWTSGNHRLALLPLLPFTIAIIGLSISPQPAPVRPPMNPAQANGLQLLGYQLDVNGQGHSYIRPFWQVTNHPTTDLKIHWRIDNTDGTPIADSTVLPYYNTSPADLYPPGTIVDDAHTLPLPPGLPAGTYRLSVAVTVSGDNSEPAEPNFQPLGEFELHQTVATQPQPDHPVQAHFGENISLVGYMTDPPRPTQSSVDSPVPEMQEVTAGDYIRFHLTWSTTSTLNNNYHGFVHLVDHKGVPLVQEDQLPGPYFQPPRLWQYEERRPDIYLLRIPKDAQSNLYYPTVGLYDFATLDRLPANSAGTQEPQDHIRLAPLKVVNRNSPQPATAMSYRLGNFAELLGYDLSLPESAVHPGDTLELILYYRATQRPPANYVRFLQLYRPEHGVVAQSDAPPRAGGNPTGSWSSGEFIHDPVTLQLDRDAPAAEYVLYFGMYDPEADNARIPLFTQSDSPVPDNWIPLTSLHVGSGR